MTMSLLEMLIILVLARALLFAFEIREKPQAPWAPRQLFFRMGFRSAVALVAGSALAMAGFRSVSERRVPEDAWWLLPVLFFAGWVIGVNLLRLLRKDLLGRPALDGLLIGLPLGGACWLVMVGYRISSVTIWSVATLALMALGLLIMWPNRE
jgi:hypothetical protein